MCTYMVHACKYIWPLLAIELDMLNSILNFSINNDKLRNKTTFTKKNFINRHNRKSQSSPQKLIFPIRVNSVPYLVWPRVIREFIYSDSLWPGSLLSEREPSLCCFPCCKKLSKKRDWHSTMSLPSSVLDGKHSSWMHKKFRLFLKLLSKVNSLSFGKINNKRDI